MSDEIIGHTEHLLSAHIMREAIAQLDAENERLRKLLSDTNTYYAECIAEREDLRAEIRAYKRKVLSPFFKNSDMSEDEAIAYQVSVGNMRIRLHKQADEIQRLREVLTGLYKSVNEWPVEVGGDIDLALRAAKAALENK